MVEPSNQPAEQPMLPTSGGVWSDKEKMDYQAKLDLDGIAYRKGAKWREFFWDKLFFAGGNRHVKGTHIGM